MKVGIDQTVAHPTCGSCPSVQTVPGHPKFGFCHRMPPTATPETPDGKTSSVFPLVTLDTTWCDEHPESPRRKP